MAFDWAIGAVTGVVSRIGRVAMDTLGPLDRGGDGAVDTAAAGRTTSTSPSAPCGGEPRTERTGDANDVVMFLSTVVTSCSASLGDS